MWVVGFSLIELGRLASTEAPRFVALSSWGFLRAIGPAVAKRPLVEWLESRAKGPGSL